MAAIFCNNLLSCFPILLPRWASQPSTLPATNLIWRKPLCHSALASNLFTMALCHGAPASNKPHSAEKSTLVWLAIWHIWAGFANSQLLRAAFRSTY